MNLTVTEPTEYIDRSYPTASWWVKYELQLGSYEIVPWSNLRDESKNILSIEHSNTLKQQSHLDVSEQMIQKVTHGQEVVKQTTMYTVQAVAHYSGKD